jgi:hypothetical protein
VDIGRSRFKASLGKKASENLSKKNEQGMVDHVFNLSYMEAEVEGSQSDDGTSPKFKTFSEK